MKLSLMSSWAGISTLTPHPNLWQHQTKKPTTEGYKAPRNPQSLWLDRLRFSDLLPVDNRGQTFLIRL